MFRTGFWAACVLSACLTLPGCGKPPQSGGDADQALPAAPAHETDGTRQASDAIDWHRGDIDAAFALAAQQDRPVFLYWGADWCPPCNQIKATVFSKPEFVAKSRLFVPVYLDGDTERAQRLGEQFGVMGYPTMIVFDAAGQELTRIPGGLDISLYGEVLDLTLAGVRPVQEVLRAVMAGEAVTADDYRLLAFYSWGQDNERALADVDPVTAFEAAYDSCPVELEAARARLYGEYLMARLAAAADEEDPRPLSAAQRASAIEHITRILANDAIARANLPLLIGYADDMVGGLTDPGSTERAALISVWTERLDALAADAQVSVADRVYPALVKVRFARLDNEDGPIDAALLDEVRARVAWADDAAKTPYQRQAVINVAWYTLYQAGLETQAEEMLLAELERSRQPYYFMVDLADLKKEAGDYEAAILWLRKAYDSSEGIATRFQWGYNYVSGLLEMAPEDPETIAAATRKLLAELDGHEDAIYGRTARILKRLGGELREWNENGQFDAQIAQIQAQVDGLCADIPDGDGAIGTCREFLEEA